MVSNEGTSQVNETKIRMLTHSYELFKMNEIETISDMFDRFITIMNELKNLGKVYTNQENVKKLLRCLPPSWDPKVTAIEEAKDVKTLPLEELLGSLLTHELTMKQRQIEEVEKKKKSIAFKLSIKENEKFLEEEEETSNDEDEDIALLSRKIGKLLRNRKLRRNGNFIKRDASKGERGERQRREQIVCYECKKPGHIKYDCPLLKIGRSKKKAMKATWDDSDESESEKEDNEVANMCFMATTNNEVTNSNSSNTFDDLDDIDDEIDENPSYEELYDTLEEMNEKLALCMSKNATLKKKNFNLERKMSP